jgi:hypothetical protein
LIGRDFFVSRYSSSKLSFLENKEVMGIQLFFNEKHPESEVVEVCNLMIEKILGGNRAKLLEDKSTYYEL